MKTVIVPTDFSENAANAIRYAIEMSKLHYQKLIFVHIYSLPLINPEMGVVYDAALADSLASQYDGFLRKAVEKAYHDLGINRNLLLSELEVVESFSIAGGIDKMINKYNATAVIMGTHGATGLKKVFLGSNTVDVVKNISIPVLTVPSGASFHGLKHIGYASDFNDIENELKDIIAFAQIYQSKIHIFHIATKANAKNESELHATYKKWYTNEKYDNYTLHLVSENESQSIEEGIKKMVAQVNADLLIMFHKQRNLWQTIFSKSYTAEMVYEWQSPILVIPKK